jgi:hypothetical protein
VTKRAYIPSNQVEEIFRRKMQQLSERNQALVESAFRDLEELDKQRRKLRPEVYQEEEGKLRARHRAVCEAVMQQIRELAADAEAQLEFSYQPLNLRHRQLFALPPEKATALRAELRDATGAWLLRSAQRARAEGDVAAAVAIEEEAARRSEIGRPLDTHLRDEIHRASEETTNDALTQDLDARVLLLKTTHMAEAARLKLGELTGETKPIDKIKYGVRVYKDLGVRIMPEADQPDA